MYHHCKITPSLYFVNFAAATNQCSLTSLPPIFSHGEPKGLFPSYDCPQCVNRKVNNTSLCFYVSVMLLPCQIPIYWTSSSAANPWKYPNKIAEYCYTICSYSTKLEFLYWVHPLISGNCLGNLFGASSSYVDPGDQHHLACFWYIENLVMLQPVLY